MGSNSTNNTIEGSSKITDEKKKIKNGHIENYIIIGNGFDLNCGISSSYNNFINSIKKTRNTNLEVYKHNKLYVEDSVLNTWADFEERYIQLFNDYNNIKDIYEQRDLKEKLNNNIYELEQEFQEYMELELESWVQKNSSLQINDFWIKFFTMDNMLIDNFNYTDLNELFLVAGNDIDARTKNTLRKNFSSKILCNIHGKLKDSNIIFGSSSLDTKNSSGIDKESRRITVEQRDNVINEISNIYILGHSIIGSDYNYLLEKMEIAENIIIFYYKEDYKRKLNILPKDIKNKLVLFPIVPFFKEVVNEMYIDDDAKIRLFDQHADMKSNKRNRKLVSWLNYTFDSKLLYTNKTNLEFRWNFSRDGDEVLKTILSNSNSFKTLKIVNEQEYDEKDDSEDGDKRDKTFVLNKDIINEINTEKLELFNFSIDKEIEKCLQNTNTLKLINCKLSSDIQVYSNCLKRIYAVNLQNINQGSYTIYIRQCIDLQSLNLESSNDVNIFYDNAASITMFTAEVGNLELSNINYKNIEVFHIEADNEIELERIDFTYDKIEKIVIDARQNTSFENAEPFDITLIINKGINYLPNLKEFGMYGYPYEGRLDNLADNNIQFDGNISYACQDTEISKKYQNVNSKNIVQSTDFEKTRVQQKRLNNKPLTIQEKEKYLEHISKYNIYDVKEQFFELVEKQRSGKLLESNSSEYVEVLKNSDTWKAPEGVSSLRARSLFKKESFNLVEETETMYRME